VPPRRKTVSLWTEAYRTPEEWLSQVQTRLRLDGAAGFAGGGYDDWDLEVQGGILGAVRTRMAVEDHGAGTQMLRFRIWPRFSASGLSVLTLLLLISLAAGYDHSWLVATLLFSGGIVLGGRMAYECAVAMQRLTNVLDGFRAKPDKESSEETAAKPVALAARNPLL
jgi:hypothetical protein